MQKPVKKTLYLLHFDINFNNEIPLCLFKVLDEFSKQVDSIDWPSGNPETINYKALDIHLSKYQVSF